MLPFLLLGTALIFITGRYTMRQTVNAHALWTSTVFRELQRIDNQMTDIQSQLLWDKTIPEIVFPEEYYQSDQLRERLYTLKTSGKICRSIWYSTCEDQFLFSDTGTMSVDLFISWRYPEAANDADSFRKEVLTSTVPVALRSRDSVYGDQVIMLFYPVWHTPHTRSVFPLLHHVCFVIPAVTIESIVTEADPDQDYAAVCTFGGKTVFSKGNISIDPEKQDAAGAEEIEGLNAESVSMYRIGGDTVFAISQGNWGMTVAVRNLFSGQGTFVLYTILLTALFFAAGCYLSVCRTRRVFRPIDSIRQHAAQLTNSNEETDRSEDVFGAVQQHLLQLSAQKGILTDQIENNRFMTESLVANLLLYGINDSPEMPNILALLPHVPPSKYCCRVMLILTTRNAQKEQAKLRQFFPENAGITLLCVKSSVKDAVAAILFYPPEEEKETYDRFECYTVNAPDIIAGISSAETDLARIPILLPEAAAAVNQRMRNGKQNLFFADRGQDAFDNNETENPNMRKQLIEQISQRAGAMSDLEEASAICIEALRLLKKEQPDPSLHPAVYVQTFLEPYTAFSEGRAADLRPIAHLLRETAKNAEEEPVEEQMRSYIQVHYTQCDFSLKNMADEFHMSESGLSNYFNKQFGQSVLDYLTELRMKLAVTLLCETIKSIQEIGEMTGYVNTNSFIRRFKQIMGETPGEFRRNNASAQPGNQFTQKNR